MAEEEIAEVGQSAFQVISSSFVTILVSELGDKTFFLCAMLAMKYSRAAVFTGNLIGMSFMLVLAASIGHAAMVFINPLYVKLASILVFSLFAATSFVEGLKKEEEEKELENKEDEEAEDAEEEKETDSDELLEPLSTCRVIWKTIALISLAEWGDKSQISIVTLAAISNAFYVAIGAVLGIALCSFLAVMMGSILSKYISEKKMSVIAGVVFAIFAIITSIVVIFEYIEV